MDDVMQISKHSNNNSFFIQGYSVSYNILAAINGILPNFLHM